MRESATRSAFECISVTHNWKRSEIQAIPEILPIGLRFNLPSVSFSLAVEPVVWQLGPACAEDRRAFKQMLQPHEWVELTINDS